jgi:hypothetical protein
MLIKINILFIDQFVLIVLTFKIHMLKPDYNMNSKLHLTTITASAFTVSLIIIRIITATPTITTIAKTASSFTFIQDAFADHGQEIVLSLNDSSFAPINIGKGEGEGEGEGNQVKVVVNYVAQDPMIANDLVKGVMKVYSQNGTLIKTSSSPTPFPVSSSGTVQFATTLSNPTAESVTANIVFTNPIKTEILSNELPVKLDLAKRPQTTTTATTTTEEAEPQKQQQQTEPKKVATFGEEEEQQLIPLDPLPQKTTTTTTITSVPTTLATTANTYIKEICNDGVDNDVDTRTDLSDEECNNNPLSPTLSQTPASGLTSPPTPTPTPTQPLEQQITTATPEICNDGLDNDIDGKIDTQDEDCMVGTPLSSSPTSLQGQLMIEEQEEGGDDDQEKRSDGDDGVEEARQENDDDDGDSEDDEEGGDEDED